MTANTALVLLIQDRYDIIMYPLLIAITLFAAICFFVALNYCRRLTKIAEEKKELDHRDYNVSQQFNSLMNSLNDIIFEFDEDKVCLNVWFNDTVDRIIDPKETVGKTLTEVIGPEKAKKFDDALDYVIEHRKSTSVEYISDFGTGEWFIAKLTPVFDRGVYTSRISASLTNISAQKKYEQALKENEILLLEAQVVAKTGNWWYDHATKETYWSDNMYAVLEIDSIPENVTRLDYYISLVHPEDREGTFQYLLTMHKRSAPSQYEHRLITPAGNLKYIKVLKGNESKVHAKRISSVVQDVTQSKLTEKAIKLSRTELIEAQTIAKIGNWKWSTTLEAVEWSDEISAIFGIKQPGATALEAVKILFNHVDVNDRAVLKHFLKNAETINEQSFVIKINTAGDKVKYLSIIVGKLMKHDDGSTRKIIGTLQDITERKEAEIAYQTTENKYKLVLERIKLAAISLDSNGIVTFCNQYLANLMGYDQQEILGKKWLGFIPKATGEVITGWYANNAIIPQHINPVICRNGEQRLISWQNTVSYDEKGLIKENTAIGEDITDQQKATQDLISAKELAEKSSEFKSEFLSIMSHEIRTPMNAVIGTTNLLLSEDPKPEQLDYLNILKFSADNLLAIINDILDYNKIEAGKLELHIKEFNIHLLVQKIVKSFNIRALEKLLQIDLVIDKTIPEFIIGDQMRLSQVLNNLISNAVKFTQRGTVTIRLDNIVLHNDEVEVKFTISDTGIGIATDNLRLIFDPFMQEAQFINSNSGGTGLGLAITKRLLALHNSNIHVTSELGKGTEFTFSILFDLPASGTIRQPIADEGPMLNLYGMSILLVDDNKMNLLIAAKFLNKWQANVDEAPDGKVAVEMVKEKLYDLIIMDLQMPVMDGFEATGIIKKSHPDIPIIALTANAMPETYSKAIASGMSDYLTKPFVPGIFFEKVSKFYKPV